MRISLLALGAATLMLARPAQADINDFPLREADRPLVLTAGLLEMSLIAGDVQAAGDYDADGHFVHAQPGDVTHALVATGIVRYGVFRNFEIGAVVPWTADLQAVASSQTASGTGRVALTGAWSPLPREVADFAAQGALLLPTTSQELRTDSAGVVHHDHLALFGALSAKRLLFADGAGHLEAGVIYPFANADDQAAGTTPPATLLADAGVILQASDRLWLDAAGSFTRTAENRINGGAVPSSDQYLLALTPTAGFSPTRWYDFALTATVPLAGKNTPQAFELDGRLRARF